MSNPRTIAIVAVAAATVGGGTIAVTAGGSTPTISAAGTRSATSPVPASSHRSAAATLQTTTATVQGTKERILLDAKRLPLYMYKPDTATKSLVSGQLAVLWPPLVASAPSARGATGFLTSVPTANGRQVAYNGHFLYTFGQDSPGQVPGQGVQDFLVATPGISTTTGHTRAHPPIPASNGYH
jgi:predicted lipoprotein with Yx(FWY)xxD motif